MATAFLHFVVGTAGAFAIFLVLTRISGATSFSAPFGVFLVGIVCANFAHFMSPWATPAVLLFYALAAVSEHVRDQKDLKVAQKGEERDGEE